MGELLQDENGKLSTPEQTKVDVVASSDDIVTPIPVSIPNEIPLVSAGRVDTKTKGPSDFSDLMPPKKGALPTQLPIRGEKRIIPVFMDVGDTTAGFNRARGNDSDAIVNDNSIDYDDFAIVSAKKAFKDYVLIRIDHRGVDENGNPNDQPAEYRFLINPATVQVSRETVDAQAFTRAGWQFGVWGEGLIRVNLSGQTAGQFFALGLTDEYHAYTKSWRNLQQLVMFFENNGYFWEGEQAVSGPLAADFSRRRIKCHQDVQLIVGNFMWYGMFDTLSVSLDAEKPFLASFNISFLAWKERFRTGSPYPDTIANNVQRGHSYGVNMGFGQSMGLNGILPFSNPLPPVTGDNPDAPEEDEQPTAAMKSPAEKAEKKAETLPTTATNAMSFSPTDNILYDSKPWNKNFWKGRVGKFDEDI